ncbi:hypothetical protein LINGRAHAP2_LOCUS25150, partial [Linum grandiflorum]
SLNFNGSVIPETVQAVAGGLFRDADSRCLAAYSMNPRVFSITQAELSADVQLFKGYRKIRVQLDSQFLLVEGEITHQYSSEIASFPELLDRN